MPMKTSVLTDRGSFVDDIKRTAMLHACCVRIPIARARINSIGASTALALPGVQAVFTAVDLSPNVKDEMVGTDVPDTPPPVLAEGRRSSAVTWLRL
ncbi:hypothetical protein [Mycobacterium lepromatosis]